MSDTNELPYKVLIPRTARHKRCRWIYSADGRSIAKVYGGTEQVPDELVVALNKFTYDPSGELRAAIDKARGQA